MKLVSRKWQEVKDDKEITERYEYLSLRDREAYAELKKFYDKASIGAHIEDQSDLRRTGRSRLCSYDQVEAQDVVVEQPQVKHRKMSADAVDATTNLYIAQPVQ